MKKICIIGGAGFVGTYLSKKFLSLGYSVCIFDIKKSSITDQNLESKIVNFLSDDIDVTIFENSYGVISLLGVPIFGRFTKRYKRLIYDSRIFTTRKIVDILRKTTSKPKIFISASAIGFYGDTKGRIVDELSQPGTDFLSQVCVDWEKETQNIEQYNITAASIRNAHVLGKGGLVTVLSRLFSKNLGGYFGTGKQHMPWIDIDNLVSLYAYVVENNLAGTYNAVESNPTQKEFMVAIKKTLKKSIAWRIPPFLGKIVYGEFINVLLADTIVDNTKIKKTRFVFNEQTLEEVLQKYI